jgi:chorismate-pyruvate lyase
MCYQVNASLSEQCMSADHNALLFPLDTFFADAQKSVPSITQIAGHDMPEPYRTLLVHRGDMTPALENHYNQTIHLNLLQARREGNFYLREVVLMLDASNLAVEYGAIAINLDCFSPAAREIVLDGKRPLGTILREQKMAHSSQPRAYLQIEPDATIAADLQLAVPTILYGRRNRLLAEDGASLAEIVEILSGRAK